MEFYSQNLSIGLAEPVVFALMAAFIFGDPLRWRRWRLALVTSIAFALITALEFWTGQIPFATAAGLGLLGLGISCRDDIPTAVSRGLDFLAVAGTTVVAMFGLKIAIASIVFQENVLANFLNQLEIRVADGNFSLLDLILHMAGRADHIGQGSLVLGLVSGLAALLALAVGAVRLFGSSSPSSEDAVLARARAAFLLISIGIIVFWHLLFRNHSTIHSEFMIRTFTWAISACWILLAEALRVRSEARLWRRPPNSGAAAGWRRGPA